MPQEEQLQSPSLMSSDQGRPAVLASVFGRHGPSLGLVASLEDWWRTRDSRREAQQFPVLFLCRKPEAVVGEEDLAEASPCRLVFLVLALLLCCGSDGRWYPIKTKQNITKT